MTIASRTRRLLDRLFNRITSIPAREASRDMRRAVAEALDDVLGPKGSVMAQARTAILTETYRQANMDERNRAMAEGSGVVWHCEAEPCPICAPYCGQTFGPMETVEMPPVHPNCRCVALAETP